MYNANYMDGVPVKIAEKYKPPPAIYKLPQSLANKLNLENNYYWICTAFAYDLQLEHKALTKIQQWKRIRQRDKELRKERISRRELQRKREDEEKQKNLLYSVSYPSTDDLSSGNEEESDEVTKIKDEILTDILPKKGSAPQISVAKTTENSFHNILQPTVLSYSSNSSNATNSSHHVTTPVITSFDSKLSVNTFNYKDFEDDTSSPFDNIELKTINDLDVLAQVLHNTQIKSPVDKKLKETMVGDPVNNLKESEPEPCDSYCIPEITNEDIPKANNNLPRFENYSYNTSQAAFSTEVRDQNTISENTMQYNANLTANALTPQHHYYNGLQKSNAYFNSESLNNYQSNVASPLTNNRLLAVTDDQVIKSKSVPDIIKELRDEIRNSEIRRHRNCSYNKEEVSTQNTGKHYI